LTAALRYEVTVEVEPALAETFVRYMSGKHIPEVLATGCFRRIRLDRAGPTTFRTVYEAATPDDLDRYLRNHTAGFRADFASHFPAGVTATRAIWTQVALWE
jgi:cytochrome b